jgi:Spy/CpxP family protein refolding chaperone
MAWKTEEDSFMKNRIVALLLTAGILGVAMQSAARPHSGHESMDPLEHIERMAEHLNLSSEQEQQITDIVNAAEIATAADRERMRQIHEELRQLSEAFDEGVAQGLADEIGQLTARLAYSHVSTMAAVRAVFTAEQLQELEELRAQREEFQDKFGGRPRGMFGGE